MSLPSSQSRDNMCLRAPFTCLCLMHVPLAFVQPDLRDEPETGQVRVEHEKIKKKPLAEA